MVDLGMNGLIFGELVRQRAKQRQDRHKTPILSHLHLKYIDLKDVAGFCALHIDRPGNEMRPRSLNQRIEGREIIGRHQASILR